MDLFDFQIYLVWLQVETFLTVLSSKDGRKLTLSFRQLILKIFGQQNTGVIEAKIKSLDDK